jgi:hypothetical protein
VGAGGAEGDECAFRRGVWAEWAQDCVEGFVNRLRGTGDRERGSAQLQHSRPINALSASSRVLKGLPRKELCARRTMVGLYGTNGKTVFVPSDYFSSVSLLISHKPWEEQDTGPRRAAD